VKFHAFGCKYSLRHKFSQGFPQVINNIVALKTCDRDIELLREKPVFVE
jgi:hypothetical protein